MKASIMSYTGGLQVYEGVRMVRVISEEYNLLIMPGFAPTLGKIDGTVTVLTDTGETEYSDIHGFFQQKDDVFSLLVGRIQ